MHAGCRDSEYRTEGFGVRFMVRQTQKAFICWEFMCFSQIIRICERLLSLFHNPAALGRFAILDLYVCFHFLQIFRTGVFCNLRSASAFEK